MAFECGICPRPAPGKSNDAVANYNMPLRYFKQGPPREEPGASMVAKGGSVC
jgi:hypothetical protein